MTLRLKTFLTGLLAWMMALTLGLASVQAKPAVGLAQSTEKSALGGYQLFEQAQSEIEAPIQLASLGNFDWSTETASEYANAPKGGVGLDRLPCCFVAGTAIKTVDGYENIEDLKVGDEVLSQNVETGTIETNLVTDTHIRPISEIKTFYKLTIGLNGRSEDLFVTGEHPFWVTDRKEWITVDEIEVGAQLTNHQGQNLSVQAKALQSELQQTYNITVAGNNNYFAGRLEALVHNCGEIVGRTANGRPIHAVGRDGGTDLYVQAPNGSYVNAQRYDLATGMGRPTASDPRLAQAINDNYRPGASVGSGSTADAVRHEIRTGQQVGNRTHTTKAQEQITRLQGWLRNNPGASSGDIRTAQNMIIDMEDALATPRP